MKFLFALFIGVYAVSAFAIGCDCEVRVYSPITGSYKLPPKNLKTYELEEFSSYSIKNQKECRDSCLKEFEKDMSLEKLNSLLVGYGQALIDQGVQGYNCTGLTTLKFPVRVKASLGRMGLGNVSDLIQVVTTEQACF